jgi:hypothetical protein
MPATMMLVIFDHVISSASFALKQRHVRRSQGLAAKPICRPVPPIGPADKDDLKTPGLTLAAIGGCLAVRWRQAGLDRRPGGGPLSREDTDDRGFRA